MLAARAPAGHQVGGGGDRGFDVREDFRGFELFSCVAGEVDFDVDIERGADGGVFGK